MAYLICFLLVITWGCAVWASMWVDGDRPIFGYFLGLAPVTLLSAWLLNFYFSCPSDPMANCEWTWVGILGVSVAYTVFWLVYTLLFVVLYIRHRRQESYT